MNSRRRVALFVGVNKKGTGEKDDGLKYGLPRQPSNLGGICVME